MFIVCALLSNVRLGTLRDQCGKAESSNSDIRAEKRSYSCCCDDIIPKIYIFFLVILKAVLLLAPIYRSMLALPNISKSRCSEVLHADVLNIRIFRDQCHGLNPQDCPRHLR
jgi:hypothetical protein